MKGIHETGAHIREQTNEGQGGGDRTTRKKNACQSKSRELKTNEER